MLSEVDVFISNYTLVDPEIYQLWVDGHTSILALTSAPIPHCGQPCSTVNKCFVFTTDCIMVSTSNGLRERRLITSASIPFPASSLAASRASSTALECATNVT
ncbi:hypothetical protein ALC56_10740 [Trachymyrmex septentrionalis]|uniref:Uncharacterized protein n=1 Tax=Trachymyrmex septentrionalis TaxID=34720 RepID=A0A195F3L7_9HYME|nr:hypothetical protein ALC56_10740 [Trachymyrmex septentrionalis]